MLDVLRSANSWYIASLVRWCNVLVRPYIAHVGAVTAAAADDGFGGLAGDMMGLGIAPSEDATASRTYEDSFM